MNALTTNEIIERIRKLELENKSLKEQKDLYMEDKQRAVSKGEEVDIKITYNNNELNDAWALLKESIVKGKVE